ncbi:hypothetical protein NM208_g817 [Fusarium decemcellulare]|uniref:Uncharacterized protein n=1 Tax=Fusarium decemcellulare TaxID=57161 RepID=A0ACC1SY27_9HYPO|nr:hypothetical protein NM208_g817 [Fusarium decemcellulare]
MKASVVFTIFSATSASASASLLHKPGPKALKAPTEGYEVAPLKWTANAGKRGANVARDGSTENYSDPNKYDEERSFEKRDGFLCDVGGSGAAREKAIEEGIKYLRGELGNAPCGLDSGPRVCTRVSCSYDSAIWLCNDNNGPLQVACGQIGDLAQRILSGCPNPQGQFFTNANWNVIIGKEGC